MPRVRDKRVMVFRRVAVNERRNGDRRWQDIVVQNDRRLAQRRVAVAPRRKLLDRRLGRQVGRVADEITQLVDVLTSPKQKVVTPTPPDKEGAEELRDVLGSNPRRLPQPGPARQALDSWRQRATAPKQMVPAAGTNNQKAKAGSDVPNRPTVTVTDVNGAPVALVDVTFTVEAGGGSMLNPATNTRVRLIRATTDAAGIAFVNSWRLGTKPGSNIVTATVAGVSVNFKATGH
jgi:hypothetical protein